VTDSQAPDVGNLIRAGRSAQQRGDWATARSVLEEGLRAYPDEVMLLYELGVAHRRSGQYEDAVAMLRRAQEREPNDYDVLYQLGLALQIEDPLEARTVHERLVELFPEDPDARHVLAVDDTMLGRPERALSVLADLIARFPNEASYQTSYASALNRMGRHLEALAVLDKVLVNHPNFVDAWISLAEANLGLSRPAAWTEAAQRLRTLAPDDPLTEFWLHRVALHEGRGAAGLNHLGRTLEVLPRFVPAQLAMGSLLWEAGRDADARRWFEAAAENAPWDGHTVGMLAYFQAETGWGTPDLERLERDAFDAPYGGAAYYLARIYATEAFRDLDRARRFAAFADEHAPDNVATRMVLAEIYVRRGEFAEAAAAFRQILDLSPDVTEAWIGLAYSSLRSRDLAQAEAAYVEAIQRRPDDPDVRHGYGAALLAQGKPREAVSQLEQAARLAPDEGEIAYSLARALEQAGDLTEAATAARRAGDLLPRGHRGLGDLKTRLNASD
jgi:tetratricopeptide (TPR) repeat protein